MLAAAGLVADGCGLLLAARCGDYPNAPERDGQV